MFHTYSVVDFSYPTSPCTSHYLLYFRLSPLLLAASLRSIHLCVLSNLLTSPAHSLTSSYFTTLIFGDTFFGEDVSIRLAEHFHDYAIDTDILTFE